MNPEPVAAQNELINKTEGIYIVDAGAGTGKTFSITRRYANLLRKGQAPGDIFLATFTENAATNMKEEIINHCSYDLSELRDAPISTFHGFCRRLILRDGLDAPSYLGIDESITENTKTISNEVRERDEFRSFYDQFIRDNPDYDDFYPLIYNDSDLLKLITSLGAKGIFPTLNGWYGRGREDLLGDPERFLNLLREENKPLPGKNGPKYSELLGNLNLKDKTFLDETVTKKADIQTGKQVDPVVMKDAFNENRERLLGFVHDLYFKYIEYALGRNYINFSLQLILAYVLLMENRKLRQSTRFNYVMVDEFQDTNELQFKLSLLLSGTGNIAVVGDWKQSIYGFQYASVDNILKFKDRINSYYREINEDEHRLPYEIGDIAEIELRDNFRSSQKILDYSEGALEVRGKKDGEVSLDHKVISLEARNEPGETEVKEYLSDREEDAVLEKLVEIVESEKYGIDGRSLNYSDVAILSRNRSFARDLAKRAREMGVPCSYEGGAKIFKTDPGILFLAWLRIMVDKHSRRGWSVILDESGYNLSEVKTMLDKRDYPHRMLDFRDRLMGAHGVLEIARIVFNRYGIDNTFTDAILTALHDVLETSYLNIGDVVQFIEDNIKGGITYEVDSPRSDAATVQTIHAAKGLEYPAVFLANVNRGNFPSTVSSGEVIYYNEVVGLRQRKVYSRREKFVFDNLSTYLVSRVKGINYDEERRLLYVAMTRAQEYLYLFADQENKSTFFEDLDIPVEKISPELEKVEVKRKRSRELTVSPPEEKRPRKRPVHSVIDFPPTDSPREGRGTEFGTKIHRYAQMVAEGKIDLPPEDDSEAEDRKRVFEYIKSLSGNLYPEQEVVIPTRKEGQKIVYHGSIDLLRVDDDMVEVIDFKTDTDRSLEGEYRKQVGLYKQAADAEYPDREIVGTIFYTVSGDKVRV